MGCAQQVISSLNSTGGGFTYATWNPSDKWTGITLSNANLTATGSTTGMVRSTISKSDGKWYWELTVNTIGTSPFDTIGVASINALLNNYVGKSVFSLSYVNTGDVYYNDAVVTTISTYTTGDIIGLALDVPNRILGIYKNGSLLYNATSLSSISPPYYAAVGAFSTTYTITANFGATAFAYTVPSGYNAGLYN